MTSTMLLGLVGSTQAAPTDNVQPPHPPQSIDDEFAEIARRAPAFGGLFVDSDDPSVLHVYLTDSAAEAGIAKAIAAVVQHKEPLHKRIVVSKVRYNFLQLKEWHDRLGSSLAAVDGLVWTDIDEVENRLKVGVLSADVRAVVEKELAELNIPAGVVAFEETTPIVASGNPALEAQVSPEKGGTKIASSAGTCTLGFNATLNGVSGFVTASHCGTPGVTGTSFYQPDTSSSSNWLDTRRLTLHICLSQGALRARPADTATALL